MKPIRWGILGCGNVTEIKSGPAYQQVDGFELCAVMARTPGKAQDFAKRHQVDKYYTDPLQLISDQELDAIYISTPPDSHHQYALEVAKAGKICSIEKPMALNFAQCLEIQAAFEKRKLPVYVAYYRRCLPAFKQLKACIDQGFIGKVRHLDWQFTRPPNATDLSGKVNWRTQSNVAPGGYFDDIACHGLDIFTYLLGDVQCATGLATNQQGLYSSFDAITASLTYLSGATASCAWNFASAYRQDSVTIIGSKGHLKFGIFTESPAVLETAEEHIELPMSKPSPIQLDYVKAMQDDLRGISAHPSTASSAAHTSWIMDKILGTL